MALAHGISQSSLEKLTEGVPKQPDGRDVDLKPYAKRGRKLSKKFSANIQQLFAAEASLPSGSATEEVGARSSP